MGSFIAVLLAIALCIAAYKVLRKRMADKAPPNTGAAAGGSSRGDEIPPNKA